MASLAVNHGQIPIFQPLTAALNGSVKRENNGQLLWWAAMSGFLAAEEAAPSPRVGSSAHLGLLSPIVDGQPAGSTPDDAD